MGEVGQRGVMAEQHHTLQFVVEPVNDGEQLIRVAGIQPIIHHDFLELVIELPGDDLCRRECAHAGLDTINSGFTARFANRLPIFGASHLPRSFNGRSLSGNVEFSQLDFACRMRKRVFMPEPVRGKPPPLDRYRSWEVGKGAYLGRG